MKPWYLRMFCFHRYVEFIPTWNIKGFLWWYHSAWQCERCGGIKKMRIGEIPVSYYHPNELEVL